LLCDHDGGHPLSLDAADEASQRLGVISPHTGLVVRLTSSSLYAAKGSPV